MYMRTIKTLGFFALLLSLTTGCRLCAPGYLDDYATVGGKWQRADSTTGRVGSVFSDPGASVSIASANEIEGSYYDDGFLDSHGDSEAYEEVVGPDSLDPDSEVIILGDQW